MKHLKGLVLLAFAFIYNSSISAQDTYNPWSFGLGINAINNPSTDLTHPTTGNSLEDGRYKTWNMDPAGFRMTAGRYIKSGFIFETVMSLNTITENDPASTEEFPYISVDGMVKYNIGSNFGSVNKFNPFIGVGGGYTWLDNIGAGTLNAGVGVNLWISDNLGFNIQSTVKTALKDYGIDHFQHSAGIAFKFGGKDSDNDGIFDNEDNCPNEFGLVKHNGCPDKDGDGVIDADDECPNQAGSAKLRGCPDKDNDGIPDKFDECPDLGGPLQTRGCPDRDRDSVPDKADRCPEVPGPANNRGCPFKDTDKDGLIDIQDKCPNEPGPKENNGCPDKLSQTETKKIDAFAQTILFNIGEAALNDVDRAALDEIVTIMSDFKDSKFSIEGHTDNTFTKEFNATLSNNRANAVKDYLISKGIEGSRLEARGFGEEFPIATNDNEAGRQQNRRVMIILKK